MTLRRLLVFSALLVALAVPSAAAAAPYLPPSGKVFAGVSDTGRPADTLAYAKAVGAHPAVLQAFHTWGTNPAAALARFRQFGSRAAFSISTAKSFGGPEVISPWGIAHGAGDAYPLLLGRAFAHYQKPVYVRLMPEMNGYWNPYSAYGQNGTSRGKKHSTVQYRRAWQRFVLIVRGGKLSKINAALHRLHMPKVHGRHLPKRLPSPHAAFLWVPQFRSSPAKPQNSYMHYWPGSKYVDWVGLDTFGKYDAFKAMSAFYQRFSSKPFVVSEWAPWGADTPGFVANLFAWTRSHGRAKMVLYYQGFDASDPFNISAYPQCQKRLRRELNDPRYPERPPEWPKTAG